MPKTFINEEWHKDLVEQFTNIFRDLCSTLTLETVKDGSNFYRDVQFELTPRRVEMDTLFGNDTIIDPNFYPAIDGLGKVLSRAETSRHYKMNIVWYPHDVLLKLKIRKS